MADLIPINVLIADRSYRLKIESSDEEMVRKTANLINDKITDFKNQFAGKDMQDYVSMVLLWFATEQKQSDTEQIKMEETFTKLVSLEKLVDKALEEDNS